MGPCLRARQEELRHIRAGEEGVHERPEAMANGRRPACAAVVHGIRQALSRLEGGVESPGHHGDEGGADGARVYRGVRGYSPGGAGRGRAAQVVVVRALYAVQAVARGAPHGAGHEGRNLKAWGAEAAEDLVLAVPGTTDVAQREAGVPARTTV